MFDAQAVIAPNVGRPEFGSHNWRWQTRLADALARLALAQGKHAEADQAIGELLQRAELTRAHKYLARGLVLRAELQLQRGDLRTAEHDLVAALAHADQMCYFPTRLEARSKLRQLYERTGSAAQAARMRQELGDMIADLDRYLKQPDLRHSFERGVAFHSRDV